MAELVRADMAEVGSFACRTKALADRRIGDDSVPSWATVFAYFAATVVVGIGALAMFYAPHRHGKRGRRAW